ncbi:MAG: hypothetical protein Q4P23_03255, partial [Micrococcaceae bacterium]|nr:hypothetical protein [Micrococcaceae bacterium]
MTIVTHNREFTHVIGKFHVCSRHSREVFRALPTERGILTGAGSGTSKQSTGRTIREAGKPWTGGFDDGAREPV